GALAFGRLLRGLRLARLALFALFALGLGLAVLLLAFAVLPLGLRLLALFSFGLRLALVVLVVGFYRRALLRRGFDLLLRLGELLGRAHVRHADDDGAGAADDDGHAPHRAAPEEERDRRDDDPDLGAELRPLVPLGGLLVGLDGAVVGLGVLLGLGHVALVRVAELGEVR